MIILRQKQLEFSDRQTEINLLINCCKTNTMEVLKALEMYFLDNKDVNHWLDKATSYMMKFIEGENIEVYLSFIGMFDKSTITDLIGIDGFNNFISKYNLPQVNYNISFFNSIVSDIRSKYSNIEKDNNVTLFKDKNFKYYQTALKFITLCLYGLVKPENWDDKASWIKKKIPTDINKKMIVFIKDKIVTLK